MLSVIGLHQRLLIRVLLILLLRLLLLILLLRLLLLILLRWLLLVLHWLAIHRLLRDIGRLGRLAQDYSFNGERLTTGYLVVHMFLNY